MRFLNILFSLIIIASYPVLAQNYEELGYSGQEATEVKTFMNHVDEARDRLDQIQERSPLHGKKYIKEDKVVIEAEQLASLIEEGTYVDIVTLREWNNRLPQIADLHLPSESYESSLKRHDEAIRRGEDMVKESREKLQRAKERLEEARENLEEAEYQNRMQKIQQAERRIERLQEKIEEEKERIAEYKKSMEGDT